MIPLHNSYTSHESIYTSCRVRRELAPGSKAIITMLVGKGESLNGKEVTIVEWDDARGRFKVTLSGEANGDAEGEAARFVKPENLRPTADTRTSGDRSVNVSNAAQSLLAVAAEKPPKPEEVAVAEAAAERARMQFDALLSGYVTKLPRISTGGP